MDKLKKIEEQRYVIKNNWNRLDSLSQEVGHACGITVPKYIELLDEYIKFNNDGEFMKWDKYDEFTKVVWHLFWIIKAEL